MRDKVAVQVERLRRLDLAYQAAECGLADAWALVARGLADVPLLELEEKFGAAGEVLTLVKLREAIAWLGERRKAARKAADELEEARRA